jgi:hypothetical protein
MYNLSMEKPHEIPKKTRWQVRVEPKLEKKIRNYASYSKRSINQTIIYICTMFFNHMEIYVDDFQEIIEIPEQNDSTNP